MFRGYGFIYQPKSTSEMLLQLQLDPHGRGGDMALGEKISLLAPSLHQQLFNVTNNLSDEATACFIAFARFIVLQPEDMNHAIAAEKKA